MVRHFQLVRSTVAVAFLLATSGVSAQLAVYKSVDPAGHSSYTDSSDGALRPLEATVDTESVAPHVKRRTCHPAIARVNASEAKRRLAQSELKRSLGKEPMPGETTRGPDGVAVNNRYWQRQEQLRIEVDQALRRVNFTERQLQTAGR